MHETIIRAEVVNANPKLKGIAIVARKPEEYIDVEAAAARGIPIAFIPSEGRSRKEELQITVKALEWCDREPA